jgi:hypothetical protein
LADAASEPSTISCDDEAELRPAGDEPSLDRVRLLLRGHDLEVARLDEPAHQVAARHAAVLVHEHHGNVRHVRVHREAEDQDLHDGSHEDDGDHPLVPADLEQLLHDHAPEDVHR